MSDESAEFDHARERRSLPHRYAELEAEVRPIAESAYRNELVTRGRVETLEAWRGCSFMGRLKWLFLGR